MNLPKSTEVSCNQKQVSNKSLVKCTEKDIGQSQLKIDVAKVNGCYTKKGIQKHITYERQTKAQARTSQRSRQGWIECMQFISIKAYALTTKCCGHVAKRYTQYGKNVQLNLSLAEQLK